MYEGIKCRLPKLLEVQPKPDERWKLAKIFNKRIAGITGETRLLGNMENRGNAQILPPCITPSLVTNGCLQMDSFSNTQMLLEDEENSFFAKVLTPSRYADYVIKKSARVNVICPVWEFPIDTNFINLFGTNYDVCSFDDFSKIYDEKYILRYYNNQTLPIKVQVWQPSVIEASFYQGYENVTSELKRGIDSGQLKPIKGMSYITDSHNAEDEPIELMYNNCYLYNNEVYMVRKKYIHPANSELASKKVDRFSDYDIVAFPFKKTYLIIEKRLDDKTGKEYWAGTSLDYTSNIRWLDRNVFFEAYKPVFIQNNTVMRRYEKTGYLEFENETPGENNSPKLNQPGEEDLISKIEKKIRENMFSDDEIARIRKAMQKRRTTSRIPGGEEH